MLPDGTVKEGYFENNIYRGAIPTHDLNDASESGSSFKVSNGVRTS
jgi:hypothetical protein